jgi:hypothetical protein
MPILLLLLGIGVVVALAESNAKAAPQPGLPPGQVPLTPTAPSVPGGLICPSNGVDDIGDLPIAQRDAVCNAYYNSTDVAGLYNLAMSLDAAGYHFAAARIRQKAAYLAGTAIPPLPTMPMVPMVPPVTPSPIPTPGPVPSPAPVPPGAISTGDDVKDISDPTLQRAVSSLLAQTVTPSTPAAWLTGPVYQSIAQVALGLDVTGYHTASEKLKSWLKTARPDLFSTYFNDDWSPKSGLTPLYVLPIAWPIPSVGVHAGGATGVV